MALSGGGDSLALLILALAFGRATGRPVTALTVDHQLNPASADWTRWTGDTALRLGAQWRGLRWEGDKPAHGLPAAARAARQALLADATREAGARVLLMGHTADDVAEARLMRASDTPVLTAPRVWAPSPAWPEGRGVFLMRPLLGARRAHLRAALTTLGLDWIDDPANDDLRFARSRARVRLDGSLTADMDPGPADIRELAARVQIDDTGAAFLPRDLLTPTSVARRIVAAALLCVSGAATPPRGPRLNRLLEELSHGEALVATLAGAKVTTGSSGALMVRETGDRRRGARNDPGVFDGRFEILSGEVSGTLAGHAARLSAADQALLKTFPAAARPALPVAFDAQGAPRLPRPFGSCDTEVRSLVRQRFEAACGLVTRESEIWPTADSRTTS